MNNATRDTPTEVRHDAAARRFATTVDGVDAFVDYERRGDAMVITHTRVPEAIGGRGVAGQLVRAAFDEARAQGWTVQPACSYAAAWAERHPEVSDLLG